MTTPVVTAAITTEGSTSVITTTSTPVTVQTTPSQSEGKLQELAKNLFLKWFEILKLPSLNSS